VTATTRTIGVAYHGIMGCMIFLLRSPWVGQ
jgi:hypothetical protein